MEKRVSFLFILLPFFSFSQLDSIIKKFDFEGDFRFRVEQDWNSRKSDGAYREDRSRLRYRVRAGVTYRHNDWASVGIRLRTGNPIKQQDPQITLGQRWGEFGTLPIGFEKAYFQAKWNRTKFWLGKNTYPFAKNNELFWSDNVYPEGVFAQQKFLNNQLVLNVGHFIINHHGTSFDEDAYFQAVQLEFTLLDKIKLFPGLFLFKNVQNIPDGFETYRLDYSIFQIGTQIKLNRASNLNLELDYNYNFQDYDNHDSIPTNLKDQKSGYVIGLNYGKLKEKGDWQFKATYTYLERYAAVDFLAQNDWARWDYSSYGSPDGRLTNLQGVELVTRCNLSEKMSLTLKYYKVQQLISYGSSLENGDRIRLDLDIKF